MPKAVAFLVLLVALAVPASAAAATVPVGSPVGQEAGVDEQQCIVTGCTLVQRSLADGSNGAVTRDGVLTAFHAIGHGPVRFVVLRLEGDRYTRVSDTDLVTLDGLTSYSTRVPVVAGDLIGVEIPAGVDVGQDVNPTSATWVGLHQDDAGTIGYIEPSPADGATSKLTGTLDGSLALAGDLEVAGACVVPGLAMRSLASARSALARRSCTLGSVTRRSGGRGSFVVVKQSADRGARLAEGAKVDLVLERRK
jgi:hypothetical protein